MITERSIWTHFDGLRTKLLLKTFYDFLILRHFKKNVKSHVFWNLKKNIKYVFSNTGYDYDSTSIRRPFDARSTRYQKSLRSPWRSISVAAGPLAAVTLTYLFIYLGPSAAAHTQVGPRSSSRSSNGRSAVELQSNSTCNRRLSSWFVQRFQKNWDPKQLQYIQQPQTCNKIKFKKKILAQSVTNINFVTNISVCLINFQCLWRVYIHIL